MQLHQTTVVEYVFYQSSMIGVILLAKHMSLFCANSLDQNASVILNVLTRKLKGFTFLKDEHHQLEDYLPYNYLRVRECH